MASTRLKRSTSVREAVAPAFAVGAKVAVVGACSEASCNGCQQNVRHATDILRVGVVKGRGLQKARIA